MTTTANTTAAAQREAAPGRTLGDLTAVEKIDHAREQVAGLGEFAHVIRTDAGRRADGMTPTILNAYEGQILAALALAADEVRDLAARLETAEQDRDAAQAALEDIAALARRTTGH